MFHRQVLKNKLRLITIPNKNTKAVTVLVLVPVGSRYESKNIGGLSHFVEHMMFKGTKNRPTTLDISKELDSVGAEFNAFTSKDFTGYYIKSSADKIELSLNILSDMLYNSVFDAKELEKERGVIVEEINMYEDNPLMYIESLFEQLVFGDHPLGWDIAGTREVIRRVSREEMVSYVKKHYFSGNMVVAVSGNIDEKMTAKMVEKYFAGKGQKKNENFRAFKEAQKAPRVVIRRKETEQAQLCLGFFGLSHYDKKLPALQLLALILGGNMSSRLFVNIREKHGLCYFIRASAEPYHDSGTFVVQAGLDMLRIEKAVNLILKELKRIKKSGIREKELQNAKDYLKGKVALKLEDSENVADWYAKQELFKKDLETPEEKLKKYFSVTAKDVHEVAKKIFDDKKLNLALIGPFEEDDAKRFLRLLSFK